MSSSALANLASVGQLKVEARNATEVARMISIARTRLTDAKVAGVSLEGRFSSVYNAAHAAALAALRWHGYRSENRYTVFQSLVHTLGWPAPRWRVLDAAHRRRNLAEYEGFAEFDLAGIEELITLTEALIADVGGLTGL
jgi:hypothetical protein